MSHGYDDDWVYEEEVEHHLYWGSIIAGALIAVVTGVMLNVLGLAIGAVAADPFRPGEQATEIGVAAGLWIAVSNIIGLAVGGYVAARSAPYIDRDEGMLHGLAVWALAFTIAIVIAGSSVMGAASAVLGGAAERPAAAADAGRSAGATVDRPRETAENAREIASGAAFWAFATMLLGAAGALLGSRMGSGPVNWDLRPSSRSHHHGRHDHAR